MNPIFAMSSAQQVMAARDGTKASFGKVLFRYTCPLNTIVFPSYFSGCSLTSRYHNPKSSSSNTISFAVTSNGNSSSILLSTEPSSDSNKTWALRLIALTFRRMDALSISDEQRLKITKSDC